MQENKTIILSTHDVHFAYEWADEIIVMSDGEIIYHGDPFDYFQQQEILVKAHLEKPWVFEMTQASHGKSSFFAMEGEHASQQRGMVYKSENEINSLKKVRKRKG